jgi:hypothetical protein
MVRGLASHEAQGQQMTISYQAKSGAMACCTWSLTNKPNNFKKHGSSLSLFFSLHLLSSSSLSLSSSSSLSPLSLSLFIFSLSSY